MPWQMTWEIAPQNLELEVIKKLSSNYLPLNSFISYNKDNRLDCMFYCQYCEGWIKGQPTEYQEDTLGPLCGRRGIASYCIRCGNEIDFYGVMS